MSDQITMTKRTQVKRMKKRASYEKSSIYAALDEALIATIAFNDGINTHAIPTSMWRENNYIYIHGSNGSRLIKCLSQGIEACVSVTNIHGLVLARAAPPHSINYSSVCIYGVFEIVAEGDKERSIQYFLEHWVPGRWQHLRKPYENELAAVTFLRISLTEAVLKSRQGPPKDNDDDMPRQVWAGVMPLSLQWQTPQQAEQQNNAQLPGQTLRELSVPTR